MAARPEYGEEVDLEECKEEVLESGRGPLPVWEDPGDSEFAEHQQAEEETHHPAFESNEAHHPGAVCDHCGAVIGPSEDVRRTVEGRWVHELCPGVGSKVPHVS